MTQAIVSTDPNVATLQESVRHNEKNIDRLDRDLKDFRSETLKQFEKVDQRFDKVDDRFDKLEAKTDDRFNQLETKVDQRFTKIDERFDKVNDRFNQLETKTDQRFDKINDRFNQITMLLVAIVGLIVATIVKLVFLS